MMTFGTLPYQATTFYGEVNATYESSEKGIAQLVSILQQLKNGDRTCVRELIPFLSDDSFDVRQYSQQLFAHTCTHSDVHSFEDCFDAAEDEFEVARIAFRLGETLSLSAIPLLLELFQRSDSDHVNGAIEAALRIQLGVELSIEELDFEEKCRATVASLDHSVFYYHGSPAFIGNVCKELITSALMANKERSPAVLVRQPLILANFSGVRCPLQNGDEVDDQRVSEVYSYVQKLASMGWKKGAKYFYHVEC